MLRSQKTVPFSEQVMSGDKYVSIFSKSYVLCYCVYCPSNIFRNTRRYFPVFGHVTYLNQPRERKYLMDYNDVYNPSYI